MTRWASLRRRKAAFRAKWMISRCWGPVEKFSTWWVWFRYMNLWVPKFREKSLKGVCVCAISFFGIHRTFSGRKFQFAEAASKFRISSFSSEKRSRHKWSPFPFVGSKLKRWIVGFKWNVAKKIRTKVESQKENFRSGVKRTGTDSVGEARRQSFYFEWCCPENFHRYWAKSSARKVPSS